MIRRPLNSRFNDKVLAGVKFTTIRDSFWRTDAPIMLYNWSGAAYRSKQIDVAEIEVIGCQGIDIRHTEDGSMQYNYPCNWNLWEGEGFASQTEMDEWFRPLIKKGKTVTKTLIRFKLKGGDK